MEPGPSLVAIGLLVLAGTAVTAVTARQAGAANRLSRFFLVLAALIGAFALFAGVLFVVIA